jgi:hypothetical protein
MYFHAMLPTVTFISLHGTEDHWTEARLQKCVRGSRSLLPMLLCCHKVTYKRHSVHYMRVGSLEQRTLTFLFFWFDPLFSPISWYGAWWDKDIPTGQTLPNPDDARPIVRRPTDLPGANPKSHGGSREHLLATWTPRRSHSHSQRAIATFFLFCKARKSNLPLLVVAIWQPGQLA